MEKTKRKNSPEKAHKRLTNNLIVIVLVSMVFYFFPVKIPSPFPLTFNLPIQTYALVPLLSLLFGIKYYRSYGITKWHIGLILTCFVISFLLYTKLSCRPWFYPYYAQLGNLPIHYFDACVYSWALF